MARVAQDFRTTLYFKRGTHNSLSQRFALELATEINVPEENITTEETPSHGQVSKYVPKIANKMISLQSVSFQAYEDVLAPAQAQLAAAKSAGETIEFWELYGEQAGVVGQHFSGNVIGKATSAMTPESKRMVTYTVELTTGIDQDMSTL